MRELRIEHDGVTLVASYSPAGETAIVALHGAGEGTREGMLYEHLHEVLPSAGVGVGVVTFDRRGEGESTAIVVIPEAEHELTLADGTLAPEYERTLVDWLVRHSGS